MDCAICGSEMKPDVLEATFRCPACGFFSSTLSVTINEGERIDEGAREQALKPIRQQNFRELLDGCAPVLRQGGDLLDVGCAHGWFLQAASARGFNCTGIEPDAAMAARAREHGHEIIEGYFPNALSAGRKFDVITFNDVFEHLPDVNQAADAIAERLSEEGVAIINLPMSNGTIFQLARAMARAGIRRPLARMWQEGLPSPHLSYFSPSTLTRLMERHGFHLVRSGALTSITTDNLHERIRYDRDLGRVQASVFYVGARVLFPIIQMLPADIRFFAFRRR